MAEQHIVNGNTPASCVYSTVGDGDPNTPHAPRGKLYWLVETLESGEMIIRHLDEKEWLPVGDFRPVTHEELQRDRYRPEPELYHKTVFPRLQSRYTLNPPTKASAPPAAVSPAHHADEVEQSLRTMFDQALQFAQGGDIDKAHFSLTQILGLAHLAEKKHRHLFNEFAINLRKNNLGNKAVDFYNRALELTGDEVDANLHFNLARVLFEQERYLTCTQQLFKALKVDPANWASLKFLAWMQQRGFIPKQYQLDVVAKLSNGLPHMPEALKKALLRPSDAAAPAGVSDTASVPPSIPSSPSSPSSVDVREEVETVALEPSRHDPVQTASTSPLSLPDAPPAYPGLPSIPPPYPGRDLPDAQPVHAMAVELPDSLAMPPNTASPGLPTPGEDADPKAKSERIKAALRLLESALPEDFDDGDAPLVETGFVEAPALVDGVDRPKPLLPRSLDMLLAPLGPRKFRQACRM